MNITREIEKLNKKKDILKKREFTRKNEKLNILFQEKRYFCNLDESIKKYEHMIMIRVILHHKNYANYVWRLSRVREDNYQEYMKTTIRKVKSTWRGLSR